MDQEISRSITEEVNESTRNLDQMSTLEIVTAMNREDRLVPLAVNEVLPHVAETIDRMTETLQRGGRIFYIGAGTSGRLGVLDASECPPTFGTDPERVQGVIAGGDRALRFPVEGAEDSEAQGVQDLKSRGFGAGDFLVGIAASGGTPYVRGAIRHARSIGAGTAVITANPGSPLGKEAQFAIEVETGPEVLMGSTRLKAGTAQKLILNMLSTGTMVCLGKTWRNLMVDLQPTNAKLKHRARRIVELATSVSGQEAEAALQWCNGEAKTAILVLLGGWEPDQARRHLLEAGGRVGEALDHADR